MFAEEGKIAAIVRQLKALCVCVCVVSTETPGNSAKEVIKILRGNISNTKKKGFDSDAFVALPSFFISLNGMECIHPNFGKSNKKTKQSS